MGRTSNPSNAASAPRWSATQTVATKIALGYALVGVIWIIGSDWLVHQLIANHDTVILVNTIKGWFYVSTTALLLWLALNHYFRQIRRSEELLRESEQRWQFALDGAEHGVWDWNTVTNEVFFSQRFKAMLGYGPEDFGHDVAAWETNVHPEDLPIVMAQLRPHLEGRTGSYECEHRVRCKDGTYKWILDRGQVIHRDATGKSLRMIGTHTDVTARKEAEAALATEAIRRRILVDQSHDGIVVVDQNGKVFEANQRYAEMLGYTMTEVLQLHVWDWDAQYDRPQLLQMIQTIDAAGARFQTQHRRKDGTVFDVELSNNGALIDGQKLIFCVCRDISLRKKAEHALRERELQLRLFIEHSPAAIAMFDLEMRYISYSKRWATDLRIDDKDLLGRSHYEVFPDLPQRWRDVHQRCLAGATEKCEADCFSRADGHTDWINWEVHPWRTPDHTIGGIMIFSEFITERLQAQANLQASEDRFRRVVESAPEAIFIRTGPGFAYLNTAALKLFGATSPEQLLGQPVLDRFQPEVRAAVREGIQRLDNRQGSTLSSNRTILRLDGEAVPVVISAVPFNYQDQKSSLVFARDMSAHRQLEAQFRQAQKLEAIGQLAGGVAHDFNNILAATMMHLGLLQMNPVLDAKTRQTLKELEEENRRAVTLTRQLLMFSRRSALDVKPVDLNELVANLLKMLTRLLGENIDLRSEAQAGLPLIEADAGMIDQVLMNLIVNARDAMPAGGRITIHTATAEIPAAQAELNFNRRPGRFVCLAVADAGCGMDTEILKRIFDPFFTTKEAGKGTGLGLATVHGIVAQHKGWIEVESNVGTGSTFRVFLPALSEAHQPSAPELETTTLRRGGETILLVEDDPRVRLTTGQFLRLLGYRVYDAATGPEAMTVWELHGANIELLFTDMVMPGGMNGLELAAQLQELKPGLPVILSSGYSHEVAQDGIPKKPGIVYLSKPHEPKKLSVLVRQCLDQHPHLPS